MRVEALSVSVPGRSDRILESITFTLPPGTRAALIGPNGSGKSILLAALAGLIPSEASIRAVAQPVGVVFQDPDAGWAGASVEDEIRFALACRGETGEAAADAVERTLQRFGLSALRLRPPGALSGGEKQRLQLAAAVAIRPKTLLLDEPTAYLDDRGRAALEDAIAGLDPAPDVILRATHDDGWVSSCHRVLALEAGRLVGDGAPAELLGSPDWRDRWPVAPPAAFCVGLELRRLGRLDASIPPPVTWRELESRCP